MTLAEKIAWCRKRAGLSQEELAERVGVSRQAVSKWELGDATPEVGKLLQLARTFGVTTDWLLGEDAPEEDAPPRHDETAQTPPPASGGSWVDFVPGVLGRLLRQYGWLFGVRLALGGGLFTAMGIVMRAVFNSFDRSAAGMMSSLGGGLGGAGVVWTDEAGNILSQTGGAAASPISIISGFVIGLGVITLVAGIVIARSLYPKKR